MLTNSIKQLLILIISFLVSVGKSQTTPFYVKAQKLTGTFNALHISPIEFTPQTASQIIDLFVSNLDEKGIYLIQSDVNELKKKSNDLFTSISANTDESIERYHKIYKHALQRVDSILTIIETKKLNFQENDTLYYLPYTEKTYYSINTPRHKKRWEKNVKSRCFDKLVANEDADKLSEADANTKAQEFVTPLIAKMKKKLAEEIIESYQTVESTLLNAMALRYDPHSNYFTQEVKQNFDKHLSASLESIGAYFDEDEDGNTIISYIEPGGSAWKSNQVNENDFVMGIKIGSTYFSSQEFDAYELQSKLDNSKEKKITLTLKKGSNAPKEVVLIKQKIDSQENSVIGYILTDKSARKIGYIALPAFYTDGTNINLPGCANDVAKELLKLENEGIEGLILDLRNNGGGSMQETINLAGIFVDEGPLFIYKEKKKKPTLIKDGNRGSIYKKPLIVMVNELSASASELFSNIVQDYHLGLVVGQTTYGKGTAQVVSPLDTTLINSPKLATAKDFIKITQGKFYRLNTSTHQGKGVVPDIAFMPNQLYANYRENKELYYLQPDSVNKKVSYLPNSEIAIQGLKEASDKRFKASQKFKSYQAVSDTVSQYQTRQHSVLLKWKPYLKFEQTNEALFERLSTSLENTQSVITCNNNTFDAKLNEVNEYVKEFNQRIKKSIEQDFFIEEAVLIMNDFIQLSKK
jgi:carboxyl-terminal processing protease